MLKALVFQLLEIKVLSSHWFQISTRAPPYVSEFDSKHEISSKMKGTVSAIDEKHNITVKAKEGVAEANQKLRDIDEQLRITETTKVAAALAKEKAMMGWQKAMAGAAAACVQARPWLESTTRA